MNDYYVKFSRKLYYICVVALMIFLCGWLVLKLRHMSVIDIDLGGCSLRKLGFYCPGCGGTRSVNYLLHGDFVDSIKYHPAVIYTAIVLLCYVVSHTLNILTKNKIKAMLFRPIYLYILLAIVVIQCIIKNVLILVEHIYIIG